MKRRWLCCAKIDAIIAEARASIEEYKELKQSMIVDKVMRGVRPASTVKNSGVDYLGDIPFDCQVRRIVHPKFKNRKKLWNIWKTDWEKLMS